MKLLDFFAWWKSFLVLHWGNPYNCVRLHSFPEAHRYFKKTRKPRSHRWDESQRPLYNTRAHNYRIEEIEKNCCYDLVLYSTPMIRYKRDGTVYLCGDPRTNSTQFLSQMNWGMWGKKTTTDGERHVPLSWCHNKPDYRAPNRVIVPKGFSVTLRFKGSAKIDLERSAHRPVYVYRSSDADREARAAFREKHATLLDTLVLRMSMFEAAAAWGKYDGAPFRGLGRIAGWKLLQESRRFLEDDQALAKKGGHAIVDIAQAVYNRLAAAREYGQEWLEPPSPLNNYQGVRKPILPITAYDFRRALEGAFIRLVGLDRRSGYEELPQFPKEIPRKHTFK